MDESLLEEHANFSQIQVSAGSFECSVTTDIAVFGYVDGILKVLMVKRTVGKFVDFWMLPGGVMEQDENLDDCAHKVLYALTGFTKTHFEQVKTYSDVHRHPLKRVLTVSFYALANPDKHPLVLGGNVTEIQWFDINHLPKAIAFDHRLIITDAHAFLKSNLKDKLVIDELLPEEFTLYELQTLYESILEVNLDKRNFRKRIAQLDLLQPTGKIKPGVKGGPMLYESKK